MENRKRKFRTFLVVSGVAGFLFLILALQLGRVTYAMVQYYGNDVKITDVFTSFLASFGNAPLAWLMFWRVDLRFSWIFALIWGIVVLYAYSEYDKKKDVYADAKGGQDWNNIKEYNKKYSYPLGSIKSEEPADPDGTKDIGNFIMSQDVRLNGNIRETFLNNNVFIDGAAGTGKTRYVLKPNLLQYNTSFVITDPSGEILRSAGEGLERHGYNVVVFNLNELEYSANYNPFQYITKNEDIPELISCFIKNTSDKKKTGGDEFFTKAEQQLYTALFYYIHYYEPPERQNFHTVLEMLQKADGSAQKGSESELDKMFWAIRDRGVRPDNHAPYLDKDGKQLPYKALIEGDGIGINSTAVSNYMGFRTGSDKTLQSILISANVRMQPFTVPAIADLTAKDTLHLEKLGDTRTAFFIITPTGLDAYNFLAAMLYTQMFQVLYYKGQTVNPTTFLWRYGNSAPLRSRRFKGLADGEDAMEAKRELEEEAAKYKKANVIGPKYGEPNDEGLIPEYWLIEDGSSGTILAGEDKSFHRREQAEFFLKCVNNGTAELGGEAMVSHIRFMLDEFVNVGEIPNFIEKLTTMRKFSLSCTIIVQSIGQLKERYKDDYETLIGNCSTQIFLGGSAQVDLEYFSKQMGNLTQRVQNSSESQGKGGGSTSYNYDTKELMKPAEIRTMNPLECLVVVSGQNPFKDKKYELKGHPNIQYLFGEKGAIVGPYNHRLYFKVDKVYSYTGSPDDLPDPVFEEAQLHPALGGGGSMPFPGSGFGGVVQEDFADPDRPLRRNPHRVFDPVNDMTPDARDYDARKRNRSGYERQPGGPRPFSRATVEDRQGFYSGIRKASPSIDRRFKEEEKPVEEQDPKIVNSPLTEDEREIIKKEYDRTIRNKSTARAIDGDLVDEVSDDTVFTDDDIFGV